MDILIDPEEKEIHASIGKAVEAYGKVEGAEILLIQTLLGLDYASASIVFSNVRSRPNLIESLLDRKFENKYQKYWKSCSSFLSSLSLFRNAVVHWHPAIALYTDSKQEHVVHHEHTMMHPVVGKGFGDLRPKHFPDFIEDCEFIYQELMSFNAHLMGDADASANDKLNRGFERKSKAILPRGQGLGVNR
jgi:hypothetical protein